jgi:hypothetical protein
VASGTLKFHVLPGRIPADQSPRFADSKLENPEIPPDGVAANAFINRCPGIDKD